MSDLPTPERFAELVLGCIVHDDWNATTDLPKATALIASRDLALLAPFVALADEMAADALDKRTRPVDAKVMVITRGKAVTAQYWCDRLRAAITAARGEQNQPKE